MQPDLGIGLVWFVAFLFSTTVHEAMHAFAAWKGGDPTAYHGGQVSLSPLPHIRREPVGMLIVPLLTSLTRGWAMGWASAPYDPVWATRHPRRAAIMAAAGPTGNVLLALIAFVALKMGLWLGWFVSPDTAYFDALVAMPGGVSAGLLGTVLSVFLTLNVFLGVFNLLPLPPLDGSAVFSVLIPPRFASRARELQNNGFASILGLFVAWQIFPLITGPLFSLMLELLHPGEF